VVIEIKTSILGMCNRPFMESEKRCNMCKKFDFCHLKYEKYCNGEIKRDLPNAELIKHEAWKDVNFAATKGKKLLYKMQAGGYKP